MARVDLPFLDVTLEGQTVVPAGAQPEAPNSLSNAQRLSNRRLEISLGEPWRHIERMFASRSDGIAAAIVSSPRTGEWCNWLARIPLEDQDRVRSLAPQLSSTRF